jgi:quinol monooxygenase YgiN
MSALNIGRTGDMPAEAIAIIAEVRAWPGKEDALRALTVPLVARALSEPATLLFTLHEDRDAPGHFLLYEVYASPADFDVHRAQTHVRDWFARLPELTEDGVSAVHMNIVAGG